MKLLMLNLTLALGVAIYIYLPKQQVQQPEQTQKDPVCGMTVKKDAKFRSVYKEKEHLFCSKSCKEKFDGKPEKYIKK